MGKLFRERCYAERFGLSWPRLETRSPSLLRGPATAELAAQAEGSPQPSEEPSPSPCPDKCKDEDFGPKQEGFGIWANTNQHGWSLSEGVTEINPETGQEDEPFDLLRTPVGQRDDAVPFDHYVVTNNPYPNGFILEIEFRFDPEQSALFPPNSAPHRHRPTLLGNSGIGIYSSKDKEGDSQVLYEVQITDCNRMCPPGSNELWQENGFLRMDFTEDWKPGSGDMLGSHLKLPTEPIDLIGQDKAHVDPRRATDFVDHITDDQVVVLTALLRW